MARRRAMRPTRPALKSGLLDYGAGVRTNATDGSVRPFAEFLVGGMRTKSTEPGSMTRLNWVHDRPWRRRGHPCRSAWGAGVGFDYPRGFFKEEEGGAVKTFRFNVGVLFNL